MSVARQNHVDFVATKIRCMNHLPALLARWLPDGQRSGQEWVARNPTRADRRAGSFKINMNTGRWSDFATGDSGGDPISLYAYLKGLTQVEAARALNDMLGGAV